MRSGALQQRGARQLLDVGGKRHVALLDGDVLAAVVPIMVPEWASQSRYLTRRVPSASFVWFCFQMTAQV